MTKKELKTTAYALGINEAHKNQQIVAAAQCPEMMEFIKKNASGRVGGSIPLLKAFNAGVAAEIHQQTMAYEDCDEDPNRSGRIVTRIDLCPNG